MAKLSSDHLSCRLGAFGKIGGVVVVRKAAYGKMGKASGKSCISSTDEDLELLLLLSDGKPDD